MNLAPITDVYTIPADQSYAKIPSMPAAMPKGGLAYGAEPLGMDPRFALIDKDLLADDDEKQVLVNIPRYNGPKNTRVDFYKYEQNTFNVTGIPNHPQPSCVYLRCQDEITFNVGITNGEYPVRPNYFFVQRRFQKMFWEAQNVRGIIEVPTHEFIKIAPYICNKDNLERWCKPKWNYAEKQSFANRTLYVSSFEPVLSFQSGWALLDAKRPMNQQNMVYPLAIQDYSMRFEEYSSALRTQRSYHLEPNRQFGDDLEVPNNVLGDWKVFNESLGYTSDDYGNVPFTEIKDGLRDPELVAFSENTALQANKDVSMVQMHAPEFDVYSVHGTYTAVSKLSADLDYIVNLTENPIPDPAGTMIYPDSSLPKLRIEIDTPKGFPSFMMLYTEFYNMLTLAGRPVCISTHPRIKTLRISFYGQKNPLIANLTQSELEYITKKNCHKNSAFSHAYSRDPICLIDLESLGLGREDVGYPARKRLQCTVECSMFQLPSRFEYLFSVDA